MYRYVLVEPLFEQQIYDFSIISNTLCLVQTESIKTHGNNVGPSIRQWWLTF